MEEEVVEEKNVGMALSLFSTKNPVSRSKCSSRGGYNLEKLSTYYIFKFFK